MLHLPLPSFLLHDIPTHKRRHQQKTSPPYWPQSYTRHILLSIDNFYLFIYLEEANRIQTEDLTLAMGLVLGDQATF